LGLGHNDDQYTPVLLMQGIIIRQIACGMHHTIVLQENNNVVVFGDNFYGQLGLGHNNNQCLPIVLMQKIAIREIACGRNHTMILNELNIVICLYLVIMDMIN